MEEFDTLQLQDALARMKAGDRDALDGLLQTCMQRLHRLASRMLGGFTDVKALEETGDVLQSSLLRLLNALGAITPANTREFLGLAGLQIRRELLDLARRHKCRPRAAPLGRVGDSAVGVAEPADPDSPPDLARWEAFHEAVGKLEAEQREVVSLHFYHGWTQEKVAELFGKDVRTIRRWWGAACVRLHELLGGDLPIT